MSYTLRGRIESRLAAALLPLLVGCALSAALPAWWPVEVAALMLGVGLALDAVAYHRLLDYQPGWLAVPLGLAELGLVMVLVRALDVPAPLGPALAFYGGAWLLTQALGHAGFPLLRLSYAEDGGELGWLGAGAAAVTLGVLGSAGGYAWSQLPPTVHLSAGLHRGPIVITRRENLVGERGSLIRGGIVVRASHVKVKDVSVLGGENGIDVEDAHDVVLDGVKVVGATMDGIHVRRGQVTVRDCTIDSPDGYTQGIDISFAMDLGMSTIDGCQITGGREGIVTHSALVMVHGNRVQSTALRAISVTEMSMGMVERNEVTGALGVGIYCGDRSECTIDDNTIVGTRADRSVEDRSRLGYGIQAYFDSLAEVRGNELVGNARDMSTYAGAEIVHR